MIQVGENWYDVMTTPFSILSRFFGADSEAISKEEVERLLKSSLYGEGDTVFYGEDAVADWMNAMEAVKLSENSRQFLFSELARLRGLVHRCLARSGVTVVELPMRIEIPRLSWVRPENFSGSVYKVSLASDTSVAYFEAPKHPHIVPERVFGFEGLWTRVSEAPCLEACPTLLELKREGHTVDVLVLLFADGMAGAAELHRQGWVHGDIKPSNVLLKDDQGLLCDLEGVHIPDEKGYFNNDLRLWTKQYAERFREETQDFPYDVYSAGVSLGELGDKVESYDVSEVLEIWYLQGKVPPSSLLAAHPELRKLVLDMTQKNRDLRPGMAVAEERLRKILVGVRMSA